MVSTNVIWVAFAKKSLSLQSSAKDVFNLKKMDWGRLGIRDGFQTNESDEKQQQRCSLKVVLQVSTWPLMVVREMDMKLRRAEKSAWRAGTGPQTKVLHA